MPAIDDKLSLVVVGSQIPQRTEKRITREPRVVIRVVDARTQ